MDRARTFLFGKTVFPGGNPVRGQHRGGDAVQLRRIFDQRKALSNESVEGGGTGTSHSHAWAVGQGTFPLQFRPNDQPKVLTKTGLGLR